MPRVFLNRSVQIQPKSWREIVQVIFSQVLTKEESEKSQKLPTRFGEEPFKISASIYFGFGRVEIFRFCFMRGELEQKPKARALILTIGHL